MTEITPVRVNGTTRAPSLIRTSDARTTDPHQGPARPEIPAGTARAPEARFEDEMYCTHEPHCPPADAADHDAAHVVATHPEQGWNLLCNGVVVFDDTGELLPDRTCVAPHRARPLFRTSQPRIAPDHGLAVSA